jgi:hypothetical protein
MRGIQHAAASQFDLGIAGILDHPLSRVMTIENVTHAGAPGGKLKLFA